VPKKLLTLTAGSKFDVDKALLDSCLAEMKVKRPTAEQSTEDSSAFNSMMRILSYYKLMKNTRKLFHTVYVPEILKTTISYWLDQPQLHAFDASAFYESRATQTCSSFSEVFLSCFLLLAILSPKFSSASFRLYYPLGARFRADRLPTYSICH
jgi:hypothetical protein